VNEPGTELTIGPVTVIAGAAADAGATAGAAGGATVVGMVGTEVPDPPAPHAARPKAIERETTALRAADRENTSINTPSKSRRLASGGFSPAHFRTRQFARVQSTYALVFWDDAAIPYDFRMLQRNASSQQEDDRSSAPRVFSV
jgi:hypothetical protein